MNREQYRAEMDAVSFSPDFQARTVARLTGLAREKEKKTMKKANWRIGLAAAAVAAVLTVGAYAAVVMLGPREVAQRAGNEVLAAAFESGEAIDRGLAFCGHVLLFSFLSAIIPKERPVPKQSNRRNEMITEFTDRRPTLSAVLIALLFTVAPGAFLLLGEQVPGMGEYSAKLVFVYTLVLQLILWLKVERTILIMLPFILSLIGFIISEIVYTVSMGMAPIGAGPSPLAYVFSSALVTVFGIDAAASVGGLLAYGIIVIARKLREVIIYR